MNKFLFFLYTFVLGVLLIETPTKFSYIAQHPYAFGFVGLVGLYRYGLWLVHLLRALVYERYFYSNIRQKANSTPEEQWKPARLNFVLASFLEDREILYNSIKSIVHEVRSLNLFATLCIGTASSHDEKIIINAVNRIPDSDRLKIVFVRLSAPDKRQQMGSALRALYRQGVEASDPLIFMDGDTIIQPGCLKKCLTVMGSQPEVQAVTTNEKAVVINSGFLSNIYNLRFATRNFHMHSLALSAKVLCLTGRFSVFSGKILTEEFISRIENDYFDDWYWGKIKFLSGDDKSTWFHLLKQGANMLYIPDAMIYSIEKVSTRPFTKYIDDLKRWSGNMLRNNERALALGAKQTGLFPWFVLLDQRVSMWTSVISPIVILMMLLHSLELACVLAVWIFTVRYLQSLVLFRYGRGINWTFPLLLYVNQVLNGVIKIYMLFHLNLQCWNNQGVRRDAAVSSTKFRLAFAKYIAAVYFVIFVLLLNAAVF